MYVAEESLNTITIKNIDKELHEYLKKTAKLNRRSLNNEIIYCLERYVKLSKVNSSDLLSKAREIRSRIKYQFSASEIKAAINEGRK
jgi:hypothetical protein